MGGGLGLVTISEFMTALAPQLPAGVAHTYIKRPQYEGFTIFYVGPTGTRATCQLYDVWNKLAANDTNKMTRKALRAANKALLPS